MTAPSKDEEKQVIEGINEILSRYDKDKSHLIPILQKVQQAFGYLPRIATQMVASHLEMTDVEVFGVASFYNHFRFTPLGKHPIQMCMGTACHMVGGGLVLEALERTLDIKVGGITEDMEFSLDRVACIGCCGLAPVMVIGEKIYPKMSPTKVDEALVNLKMEADGD
ncbi:MAG: NADH-quinone oxidoreductase subunit NuoE [Deltaproteobacteria bacterium]|nr:NADH-quinone oxidoreductase subunit NuoE [Deltaproteobacteria bacterium]MBW2116317.1 NADH-quinone oxidoreductase subunit NuoE [Deltaproteobacteria bacterium]MBW2342599.1 NADH-quinone oxidoreductase subunit NuoE [Deltaproteobacteria bacterium]